MQKITYVPKFLLEILFAKLFWKTLTKDYAHFLRFFVQLNSRQQAFISAQFTIFINLFRSTSIIKLL